MRIKKFVYHAVLFIAPVLIMHSIVWLSSRYQTDLNYSLEIYVRVLAYLVILNSASFFAMHRVHKNVGMLAYVIPALLSTPILFACFLVKFTDNSPDIVFYWVCVPLFISSLVYTTGFMVYQK